MDMLPGPIRVILDWLIMIMGTIFTFLAKKDEGEAEA